MRFSLVITMMTMLIIQRRCSNEIRSLVHCKSWRNELRRCQKMIMAGSQQPGLSRAANSSAASLPKCAKLTVTSCCCLNPIDPLCMDFCMLQQQSTARFIRRSYDVLAPLLRGYCAAIAIFRRYLLMIIKFDYTSGNTKRHSRRI